MGVVQQKCSECNGRGAYSRGPYPATNCNGCGGKGYVIVEAPETKLKIGNDEFIKIKLAAMKAYIGVAKSCRPAALHAALLTVFDVEPSANEPQWKEVNIDDFKALLSSASGDADFIDKLSKL